MTESKSRSHFYLFRNGTNIVIRELTESEAAKLWDTNMRWLDIPRNTLADAEQLKLLLMEHSQAEAASQ
ncbi:MAG: hypothetical protein QOD84_685 [Acidobacteriaceae bacterium]|jgi:hypothetical protein